ncbi:MULTISPECIES: SAVED domain-containing protein [Emticicia]|uniref:SAVED domain-containing protein n=1 Tax=Emticicia TaxID=312278 RepID=UPI0007D8BA5C|nr:MULTISPECIES: SAVED domain-containing protein [Emticicia]
MSNTKIPEKVKNQLLIKSGGRCQYKGCNESLYQDLVTKRSFNISYIAHIVADEPNGPRGCKIRSKLLAQELGNLMLMCDKHHRLIDKIDVAGHPEKLLLEWKVEHEERIEVVTSINPNSHSHIITYKANIGQHSPTFDFKYLANYLLPDFYPAQTSTIDLGLADSPFRDKDKIFWDAELNALETNYTQRLETLLRQNHISHISLFAFAPMPLLIKLGTLINDIHNVEIHQPIRNPKTWNLSKEVIPINYKIIEPIEKNPIVALNISLSASIDNSRITNVLGEKCSIYTITIDNPFNDFLQTKGQLNEFSKLIRLLFNQIKSEYDSSIEINIFPAMPIATAIELGRVWMPKADMPLTIYDENKINEGFFKTIEIK